VAIVSVALRFLGRDAEEKPVGAASRLTWYAVIAAFIGWVTVVTIGIGGADHPNQLYDGLFHLNVVEFILQNADASSMHMTMAAPAAQTSFYPALWHAVVSLIVPISGGVVPATNVV